MRRKEESTITSKSDHEYTPSDNDEVVIVQDDDQTILVVTRWLDRLYLDSIIAL
jgi:hypothetical protein